DVCSSDLALIDLFRKMSEAQAQYSGDGDIKIVVNSETTITLAPHDSLLFIGAAFEAAIESALRREKLFSITWRWIDSRHSVRWNLAIPAEERGPNNKEAPKVIPMSPRFTEIVRKLKGNTPRIGRELDKPIFGSLLGDRA